MLHYEKPIISFFEAVKNLRYRQVALILQTGFDPNLLLNAHNQNGLQFMVNYFGDTDARIRLQIPINKAAYINIAKLLLDSGLDANTIDILSGESVLFDAIRYDDREIVLLLLGYADMSIRNKEGETALMFAARIGTRQVMKMILEHLRLINMDGYFLRQRNRYGNTALELARASNLECAKVMTKHLIHYGNQSLGSTYHQHQHHPILSRSSSHHQLLAAAAAGIPVVHNSSRYHHHHHRRAPSHHSLLSSVGLTGETTTDDSDLDAAVVNDASLLYNKSRNSKHSLLGNSSNVSHHRSFYNQGGQMATTTAATATPMHHRHQRRGARQSKALDNLAGAQAMVSMNSDDDDDEGAVAAEAAATNSGEEAAAVQAAVEAQQQRCQQQQQAKGSKGRSVEQLRHRQQNDEDMGYMMDQFRGMRT